MPFRPHLPPSLSAHLRHHALYPRPQPPQCIPLPRRQLLHATPVHCDNHYETLSLPTTASPAEIKSAFYDLSRRHHPDHNPNDPTASTRFVHISEAYAVLGRPSSRQKYDLTLPSSSSSHQYHRQHPAGSHHSTRFGARPASGLSRRRSQFRGPPPSFYAAGGWGAQGAKREANASSAPVDEPFDTTERTVPHFDRTAHFRTQEEVDRHHRRHATRRKRVGESWGDEGGERGMLMDAFVIASVILVAALGPAFVLGNWGRVASVPNARERRGVGDRKREKG